MFLTFKFFHFTTKKIDDIKELKSNNYSVALYNASVLFSVAWVVKSSVSGAISTITLLLRNPNMVISDILKTTGIISLQIIVAVIIAFVGVYFGLQLFVSLTKNIDEFSEIKKNNISIAIIVSVIVIIIAIFIEPSVKNIVQGLIPYPSVLTNPSASVL
jgi:uncharacterized membrane protein YjfL (UPF0719 family)